MKLFALKNFKINNHRVLLLLPVYRSESVKAIVTSEIPRVYGAR